MSTLSSSERGRLYSPQAACQVDREASVRILTDSFAGFRHGGSLERALKTDLRWYLPDDILTLTDRLSMWHSLELRVPYLDHQFVSDVMSMPANLKIRRLRQKHLLKEVAARWLPAAVINHRKQGFEAPMGRWLRGPLKAMMQDTLSPAALARTGIFEPAQIERLKHEHLSGARKHSKILFSLLMFQLWHDRYAGREAAASGTASVTFAA